MTRSILAHYESKVAAGQLSADPAQAAAAQLLDALAAQLVQRAAAPKPRLLSRLLRETAKRVDEG